MIENIGNLYCGAFEACIDIGYVSNVFGDVYASGTRALSGVTISDVAGNLIGFGRSSLESSIVTNATSVCQTVCFAF